MNFSWSDHGHATAIISGIMVIIYGATGLITGHMAASEAVPLILGAVGGMGFSSHLVEVKNAMADMQALLSALQNAPASTPSAVSQTPSA